MSREMSVYLDLMRFLAAFTVFVSHLAVFASLFGAIGVIGPPAVLIFFVLSGYVIGHVTQNQDADPRTYTINRLARLYSVVVPVLVLTAVIDRIGNVFDPVAYSGFDQLLGPGAWRLLVSAVFLNEWWGVHTFLGSNWVFWSLSFEVVFYILFGILHFMRGTARVVAFAAVSVFAGPRSLIMFPLWLLGLGAYRLSKRWQPAPRMAWIGFIGSACAIALFLVWSWHHGILSEISYTPDHNVWQLAQDYVLAILFALNILSFGYVSPLFDPVVRRVGPAIRWAAGSTFTLYLMHVPMIVFVRAAVPVPHGSRIYDLCLFAIPLTTSFLVAAVTERRKEVWRRFFERCLPRMAFRPAPASSGG